MSSDHHAGHTPEELEVQRVAFVGEQDGPVEQRLKQALSELFRKERPVTGAYLVRAMVDGQPTVILGVCADGVNRSRLAAQVGAVFAAVFSANQHLDVAFLSDRQRAEVSRVCPPFFARDDVI